MSGSLRGGAMCLALLLACTAGARAVPAQQADSARIGISPQPMPAVDPDSAASRRDSVLRVGPPIRPRSALLRSLLLPGWGQASLGRGTAGAAYFGLEAGSIAMLLFAKQDLSVAKRAARDSVFVNDSTLGAPPDLGGRVRVRKSQVEDWAALIFFTHLFSAADAFVSAHLWDVRVQVHGEAQLRATGISATIPW